MTSTGPPAGKGTSNLIGRVGYFSCACAVVPKPIRRAASKKFLRSYINVSLRHSRGHRGRCPGRASRGRLHLTADPGAASDGGRVESTRAGVLEDTCDL